MSVKMRDAFVFSLMALFLILPPAQAIDVLDFQEDILLTMEQGASYEFTLTLQNVDEETTLETDGDIDDWIRFWNDDSDADISPGQPYVVVTVTVPDDAELGEYTGEIQADGKTLSDIRVKVTLELGDVIAYDALSDMDEKVGSLEDKVGDLTESISGLRTEVAVLEYNLSKRVDEIFEYQKDLDDTKKEKDKYKKRYEDTLELYTESEETNRELNDFTGAVVGTQVPGMFMGGILIGIFLTIVITSRSNFKKKLLSKISGSSGRDGYRYSYKGK